MKNLEYLKELTAVITSSVEKDPSVSYTASLLNDHQLLAKKIGEEATEVIISSLSSDIDNVKREAADLLYHLLVLLKKNELTIDDVCHELSTRHGVSGHDEKKSRK